MKKVLFAVSLMLLSVFANASSNSNPGFIYGQVPTAAQWNSYFTSKLDYNAGAQDTIPYWDASGNILNALVSGDCTASANVFTCSATNATNITTTNDLATNATYYPVFQTATGGTNPLKTDSTGLTYNPSTGVFFAEVFSGAGTSLTGTAASLTVGTATNATSATSATSVAGGTQWGVLYQSASGTTASTAAGTTSYVLTSNATSAPTWQVGVPSSTALNVIGYTAGVASGGSAVDIWTGTGNVVQMTGTGTTTGFAAAPAAGAQRQIITTGACLFTASSNLIIEGIPSGTTITLAANATVHVVAITTTQFKMTYSLSGTFTATGTGFTANPTATASYKVENGWCKLTIPQNVLTGTSNAVTFTITGLPASIVPTSTKFLALTTATNNGTIIEVAVFFLSGVMTLGTGLGNGAWTASGTKLLAGSEFTYSLN